MKKTLFFRVAMRRLAAKRSARDAALAMQATVASMARAMRQADRLGLAADQEVVATLYAYGSLARILAAYDPQAVECETARLLRCHAMVASYALRADDTGWRAERRYLRQDWQTFAKPDLSPEDRAAIRARNTEKQDAPRDLSIGGIAALAEIQADLPLSRREILRVWAESADLSARLPLARLGDGSPVDRIVMAWATIRKSNPPIVTREVPADTDRARWARVMAGKVSAHRRALAEIDREIAECERTIGSPDATDRSKRRAAIIRTHRLADRLATLAAIDACLSARYRPLRRNVPVPSAPAPDTGAWSDPTDYRRDPIRLERIRQTGNLFATTPGSTGRGNLGARDDRAARDKIRQRMTR